MNAKVRTIVFYLFNDVELLDFAGPMEVFSILCRGDQPAFQILTCSSNGQPIVTTNGLKVTPNHGFASCPPPEILLVPGGIGSRREMKDDAVLEWIKRASRTAELVLSVCTGSLILARAGLLAGLNITTHHAAIELLKQEAPTATIRPDKRYLDNGRIIVSAGVAAGMDMAFHVIERLRGRDEALRVAKYIEYEWRD